MVEIKPSERGIDYNCALGDIKAFVDEKHERGWHDAHILDAIRAIGRAGVKQVNFIIEDLADRLEKVAKPSADCECEGLCPTMSPQSGDRKE